MDKKLFRSILLIILISLFLVFFLWKLDVVAGWLGTLIGILRPVIIGLAIALVLNNPTVALNKLYSKAFKKSKKDRSGLCKALSIISVYIVLLGFLAVVLFVIIPELFSSIKELSSNIDKYFENFNSWLDKTLEKLNAHIPENFKLVDELYKIAQKLLSNADTLFKGVLGVTQGVFGVIVDVLLGLIISVYLLIGKSKLYMQFKKICFAVFKEKTANSITNIISLINRTFSNFISGQLTEAVILGLLCYTGMMIFGFDFALLISFLIALSSLIPIVGAFIGTVPSAFLLLLIDPIKALWFVVYIVILQQIEGNLIYPHVVGSKVGLSSIWVLLAIIIGGGIGGVLGMLIGVPCMSIIYELTSAAVNKKLKEKKIENV